MKKDCTCEDGQYCDLESSPLASKAESRQENAPTMARTKWFLYIGPFTVRVPRWLWVRSRFAGSTLGGKR